MRLGLSRRGGPAGRCHPWLKLSKHHAELRKLIPLYFPSNSVSSSHESSSLENSQKIIRAIYESRALRDVNQPKNEENQCYKKPLCEPSETENNHIDVASDPIKECVKDILWNIDDNATVKLHESMNTSLIYESLNMSPIHWKCVPQIHGLSVKHCAALCGVIIKKKRKKVKRVHQLPIGSPHPDSKHESPQKSPRVPRSDAVGKSQIDAPSENSATTDPNNEPQSQPEQDKGSPGDQNCSTDPSSAHADSATTIPMQSPKKRSSPYKFPAAPPNIETHTNVPPCSISTPVIPPIKGDGDSCAKTTTTTIPNSTAIWHGCHTCRLCQSVVRPGDRCLYRFCGACYDTMEQFGRLYSRLDDLACLRDTPCPIQWPAHPFDPTMPHAAKSMFRPLQEEHGFVAPEWCDPCKVVHCLRLGFKFTSFRTVPTKNSHALSSVDLKTLEDPVFQHRARERGAQTCLARLTLDYEQTYQPAAFTDTTDPNTKSENVEPQSEDEINRRIPPLLSRFLDSLWVRPVRLASRTQLKELLADRTCVPLNDSAKCEVDRPAVVEIATSSHEQEASSTKQDSIMVSDTTNDKRVQDVELDSTTNSMDCIQAPTVVPNEHGDSTDGKLSNIVSILPVPVSAPTPMCRETTQAPPHSTTQVSCPFCRLRSHSDETKTAEVSAPSEIDVARQMLQHNLYAITLGPVPIRSRPRGLGPVDRVRPSVTSDSLTEETITVPSSSSAGQGKEVDNQSSPRDPVYAITPSDTEPSDMGGNNATLKRDSSEAADSELYSPVTVDPVPTADDSRPIQAPTDNKSEYPLVPTDDPDASKPTPVPDDSTPVYTAEQQPLSSTNNEDVRLGVADINLAPAKALELGTFLAGDPVTSDVPVVLEELSVLPASSSETVNDPLVDVKEDHNGIGTIEVPVPTEQILNDRQCSPCPEAAVETHNERFGSDELQICATCLQDFRAALRHQLHQFHVNSGDCVADLMMYPVRFCRNREIVASSQTESDSLQSPRASCGCCDSCFLFDCLAELCTVLQPDLAQVLQLVRDSSSPLPVAAGHKSSNFPEFFLPVGGPLIFGRVVMPKNPEDSLYVRRLPPKATLTTDTLADVDNRPSCFCCQSSSLHFLNRYLITRDPDRAICSGCLWTFIAAVHKSYHNPGVQRFARRLASAAAATNASVPLLSSASRRTLLDTARLALLLSTPCSGACLDCQSGRKQDKPMWYTCPGCVVRRLHRLLPTRFPLRCPRWYRRRVQLMTRAKSIEDLDPRLMCPQGTDTTVSNNLTLVDVEYTNAVIERWLLPPEPPIPVDRNADAVYISDSDSADSSENDPLLSDTSSAVSTNASPLHFSDQEAEYGADSWWDDALEYADEDGPKIDDNDVGEEEEVVDVSMQECTTAPKDSSTEPDETFSEDPTTAESTATSKRQRRMTAKAAEAAASSRRRSRSTTSVTPKDITEESASDERAHAKSDPTLDTISSEKQDEITITEKQEAEEEHVEAPSSTPDKESHDHSAAATTTTATPVTTTTEANAEGSDEDESSKQPDSDFLGPGASPHSETEPPRPTRAKRKASPLAEPLIRSKRSLKYNPRFFEDYTGDFPSLVGEGRQIRESSPAEEDDEESDHTNDCTESGARRLADRRCSRPGSHGRTDSGTRSAASSLAAPRARVDAKQTRHSTPATHEEDEIRTPYSSQKPSCLGPRVKQVSRHALKSDSTERYAPTMSAMVHAARLAAVGAKIPGGTSPNHAALAATSRATDLYGDSDDPASYENLEANGAGASRSQSNTTSEHSRRLPKRCGQCAACIGLVQACGRCTNCRLLQQRVADGQSPRSARIGPCKELICFRRRANNGAGKSGPRVKLPSSFPPSGTNGSSTSLYGPNAAGSFQKPPPGGSFISNASGHGRHHRSQPHSAESGSGQSPPSSSSVSLLETVPGLAQQLDADAWLAHSDRDENRAVLRGKALFSSNGRNDSINVYSHKPLTPIPGGDLGMRFNGSNHTDHVDADKDRIRPIEGEVITSELAHHGGYAIVTTMASAPPKEICYACGSGGGQLLFCVSCAEPYHFYCVERQFRPRRKDHFICRNCTECRHCRQLAADLRCLRCSGGYHPTCLADYPPAHTGQRGNWICPTCAICVHCGTKPFKTIDTGDPTRTLYPNNTASSSADPANSASVSIIPWSVDVNKCAACSLAEARGDVCPECDRAYLPTAKQMIQCDSCQLWMHRTCTKLTVDEYEWIARLSPERLSKFVVNCSVCQNEKRQQQQQQQPGGRALTDGTCTRAEDHPLTVDVLSNTNSTSGDAVADIEKTDGATRLRSLARDTLMERMAGLVASCRQSVHSNSPSPSLPNDSTDGVSPSWRHRYPSGDSDHASHRRIPQFDGTGDSEEDSAEYVAGKSLTPNKLFKSRQRIAQNTDRTISRASDVLLDDHPSETGVEVPSNTPVISRRLGFTSCSAALTDRGVNARHSRGTCSAQEQPLPPSVRSTHQRFTHHDPDRFGQYSGSRHSMLSDDDKASGRTPPSHQLPTNATWLVEDESETIWTSPRALIYRLLTRVLHQLSSQPGSSQRALVLRRLLRWLAVVTETSFPWLHVSEMTSDVRDVLRQTGGNFSAVLKHFELLALIEQKELLCPIVARISENQLHSRVLLSGLQAANCMASVQSCHTAITQHLKAHHRSAIGHAVPSQVPDQWRALAVAKLSTVHIQPSQCHRPHEIEVMERMRNEAREERWVEHWSAIEEEMVLHYFQRHLLRERDRLMRVNQPTRKALPSTCENHESSPVPLTEPIPESISTQPKTDPVLNGTDMMTGAAVTSQTPPSLPPTATVLDPLDEAFQDVDSVLAADQSSTTRPETTTPDRKLAARDEEQLQSVAALTSKPTNLPQPPHMTRTEVEKFYFASDDFWTASMGGTGPDSSGTGRMVSAFLDNDQDSADEDIRCCLLCGHHGDSNIEGRLLFTGADTWVHVNCALWSNEVYEEETGQLIGLCDALRRGRSSVCADCGRYGATMVCSNAHDPTCSLNDSIANPQDGRLPFQGGGGGVCFSETTLTTQAVHFACALRRRPPLPRSVFTADRSWFCSPECHRNTGRQRLTDGINEMRRVRRQRLRQKQQQRRQRYDQLKQQRGRSARFELASDVDEDDDEDEGDVFDQDEHLIDVLSNPFADPLLDNEELVELRNAVADDLEPISLGELLVCRRVFVPSDCFAASLYPASTTSRSSAYRPWIAPDDNPKLQVAAQMAVKNLAVSPNSFAFLQCSGLPASSLVITIGSLRIDRLGEVREASDALAVTKYYQNDSIAGAGVGGAPVRRWNYICPINYRARRIYWSCTKLDARISYTLHVRQTHAVHQIPSHIPYDPPVTKPYSRSADPLTSLSYEVPMPGNDSSTVVRKPNPGPPQASATPGRKEFAPNLMDNKQMDSELAKANRVPNAITSMPVLDPFPSWHRFQPSSDCANRSAAHPVTIAPSSSSEVAPSHTSPAPSLTASAVSGQLSCRVSAPKSDGGGSSMKILKAVSLAKGTPVPQSSPMLTSCSNTLTTSSSDPTTAAAACIAENAMDCAVPASASTVTPSYPSTTVFRPSSTLTMNPASVQRQSVHYEPLQPSPTPAVVTPLTQRSTPSVTGPVNTAAPQPRPLIKPIPIVQKPQFTTVRLTGHTGGVIRIQNLTGQRSGSLVTPTKDLQLAIQLNGLFQNLPTTRSPVKQSSLTNTFHQLPINGPDSSQAVQTETHMVSNIVAPRLLPQLDGALDVDEECCHDTVPPRRKRGRPPRSNHSNRHPPKRTPSITSNESSSSAHKYHRGYQHHHNHRRPHSSSTAASGHRRGGRSRRLPKEPKLLSPPPSPRGQPTRRRWIEERNRLQELAHLVSKAKQANQARLYQTEVEKHARAFRLRFAIDGVVRAAANPAVAWQTVLSRVAALRERHGLPPLIFSHADGWTQFGLNHRHVIFLIEQMCGAFHCYRYKFHYHRSKIERLRHKFTPPVPLAEGCARALIWTKPRLPAHHARDPLSFLRCTANPPPRPLFKPSQAPSYAHGQLSNGTTMFTPPPSSFPGGPTAMLLSPGEPATLLSPNEQLVCVEAARQAASLVAAQLKLPLRVREACIARAVVQATGLPVDGIPGNAVERQKATTAPGGARRTADDHANETVNGTGRDQWDESVNTADEDDDDEADEEPDEEEEEDSADFGTVSTQFKRLVSGPLARLLRVAVHPSRIHGRGLFALRGFREDEMVIEYMGELIRNLICETREVRYRAAGVDCYMFRIDPDWVIDATYAGNAARFINHSCEPNCYAKVISVDEKKHIVILAQRRIYPGEELTYDYRFPKESDKLLCNCGSYSCRRYLN